MHMSNNLPLRAACEPAVKGYRKTFWDERVMHRGQVDAAGRLSGVRLSIILTATSHQTSHFSSQSIGTARLRPLPCAASMRRIRYREAPAAITSRIRVCSAERHRVRALSSTRPDSRSVPLVQPKTLHADKF
jgi:hypothetical protein